MRIKLRCGRFISSAEESASLLLQPHSNEHEQANNNRAVRGAPVTVPSFTRCVPKSKEESDRAKNKQLSCPADSRFLAVSVLGSPNAGKSTLTNTLMGWRICSVSKKVHTTQHNTKAVLLQGNTQIVILDTPGVITLAEKRRHNLDMTMVSDPKTSAIKADLVIVLVDVSNIWTRHQLDSTIIKLLEAHKDKPAILVLNKIDLLKSKRLLLDITNQLTEGTVADQTIGIARPKKCNPPTSLMDFFKGTEKMLEKQQQPVTHDDGNTHFSNGNTGAGSSKVHYYDHSSKKHGWPHFQRIFMVSAMNGDGVEDLKEYLLAAAKTRPWVYQATFVTDQSPQEIAILAVREKLLDVLPEEIPYKVRITIHAWDVDAYGILRIVVLLKCPEKHHIKLVIGPQGQKIRQIAEAARQELTNTFRSEVSLKLIVDYQKI